MITWSYDAAVQGTALYQRPVHALPNRAALSFLSAAVNEEVETVVN
jgi:hypothetical protein